MIVCKRNNRRGTENLITGLRNGIGFKSLQDAQIVSSPKPAVRTKGAFISIGTGRNVTRTEVDHLPPSSAETKNS